TQQRCLRKGVPDSKEIRTALVWEGGLEPLGQAPCPFGWFPRQFENSSNRGAVLGAEHADEFKQISKPARNQASEARAEQKHPITGFILFQQEFVGFRKALLETAAGEEVEGGLRVLTGRQLKHKIVITDLAISLIEIEHAKQLH